MVAAGLGIAGALLAFTATFSTVIEVRSITVILAELSGWDRSGPALPLLGLFALVMVAGAVRGARPAMAALAAAGIGVLLVAILVDQPDLNNVGVFDRARDFEAEARAGKGWLFETAAGVAMLLGGVLMLLAPRRQQAPPADEPRVETGKRHQDRIVADEPRPAQGADWFADDPLAPKSQRLTQPRPPRRGGGLLGRMRDRD